MLPFPSPDSDAPPPSPTLPDETAAIADRDTAIELVAYCRGPARGAAVAGGGT